MFLVIYSFAALRSVYFIPYKENNRDAVAFFADHYRSGDCTIFLPGTRIVGRLMYWGVYYHDVTEPPLTTFEKVNENPGACSRVWVVRDSTWWLALARQQSDAENLRRFEERYAVADKRRYYGAEVTLYLRAQET
jgi:hypothetical protein